MRSPLRVGTRGSQLALSQARAVTLILEEAGERVELVIVTTAGDRLQSAPPGPPVGKRLFVKDLEDALLRRDIDLAVHSAKDMPAELPEGLEVAAALPREDPRDAIVLPSDEGGSNPSAIVARFAGGEQRRVGTGSVRRIAQLSPQMPGAIFQTVRGNVDTRIRKLDGGEFDALVLACAGLRRLDLAARISVALSVHQCVPAPGQGIVVVEGRIDNHERRGALREAHDVAAGTALAAERAVVQALGGDCQIPLGALAAVEGTSLSLDAIVCSPDGGTTIRRHASGSAEQPEDLGRRLADELVAAGALDLLAEARRAAGR